MLLLCFCTQCISTGMWHITWFVYSRTSNFIGPLWVAALLFLGVVPFLTLFVYCFPNQSCEFLWELQGHPLSKPNISPYMIMFWFKFFYGLKTYEPLLLWFYRQGSHSLEKSLNFGGIGGLEFHFSLKRP